MVCNFCPVERTGYKIGAPKAGIYVPVLLRWNKLNSPSIFSFRYRLFNDYIGNGQPWDLNRNWGGAHVLPPYTQSKTESWYKGTANAI